MKADKYLKTCSEEERDFVYDRMLDQPMFEVVEELLTYIEHDPVKKLVEDYRKETK